MRRWSFFSSRRRHTRYWRDWSSDVCSSDLELNRAVFTDAKLSGVRFTYSDLARAELKGLDLAGVDFTGAYLFLTHVEGARSEERRVGKACRSRWSPYH